MDNKVGKNDQQNMPKWIAWNCKCAKHCYRNYFEVPKILTLKQGMSKSNKGGAE